MSRASTLIALLPLLGLTAALAGAGGTAPDLPLSVAERAAVRELVEKELHKRGLLKGKVYLTGIDVPPDNHPDSPRRALVTHYRYDGDLAILTAVDLDRRAVLSVDAVPHMPTSLAPEELAEAVRLAKESPEVARGLARYRGVKVEVDASLTLCGDRDAPEFGHRLVHLYFRQGRDYLLSAPKVEVDLTTGKVRVDRPDKAHTQ